MHHFHISATVAVTLESKEQDPWPIAASRAAKMDLRQNMRASPGGLDERGRIKETLRLQWP